MRRAAYENRIEQRAPGGYLMPSVDLLTLPLMELSPQSGLDFSDVTLALRWWEEPTSSSLHRSGPRRQPPPPGRTPELNPKPDLRLGLKA